MLVPASLAIDISGPGSWPDLILSSARWLVYCATRAWMTRSASCWRTSGSLGRARSGGPSRSPGCSRPPPPPPPPAPIAARSFISVVRATVQPLLTSPRRWASGTRTSVKNTSLKLAPPVIWRSGRISTPGRLHVDDEAGEALVLGQVGVGAGDDLADVAVVGARGPHLLAGDDPLVAVALGLGLQAGEVAAGARLAEELAADDVAAVHRLAGSASFASSVPWARIVGATMPRPMVKNALVRGLVLGLERRRTPARGPPVRPRPPNSSGPVIQPRPASKRLARHSWALARPLQLGLGVASPRTGRRRRCPRPTRTCCLLLLLRGVGLEEGGDLGAEVVDADHGVDGRRRSGGSRYGAGERASAGATGPKKIKSVVAMTEVMATTPLTRCGWRRSVDSRWSSPM